jgi:thiamine biosynthesis lipoprotein
LPSASLTALDDGHVYSFFAMGSPCEARIESRDAELAVAIGETVRREAERIEAKYSRYRPDSVLSRLGLIDYAAQCYRLSGGRFDISSGVLRRVWRFDGSDQVPSRAAVRAILPLVGWPKVTWRAPDLTLPPGMELDFGGLAKEYAVDRAVLAVQDMTDTSVLVNFGGDLRVTGPRKSGPWRAAIESATEEAAAEGVLEFTSGAVTTSGDARRFLLRDGIRYSHILDPRTGWPVRDPPRSVTVFAPTCIEAGFLSTLAMLQGSSAKEFLRAEGVRAWCS